MKQHRISRALSHEQAGYVHRLLGHRCFEYGHVELRAVRLKTGSIRISLETPWEYPKTFIVRQEGDNHNRITLQLHIYEEYCRAYNQFINVPDVADIAFPAGYRNIRGPLELRNIAIRYGEELRDLITRAAQKGGKDKVRTADQHLIIGLNEHYGLLPAISYIRYEQDEFSIVYSEGKTRIELSSLLPQSVTGGLTGLTVDKIIGPGFGRDVQKLIDVEPKRSRTILRVETILCLIFPQENTG